MRLFLVVLYEQRFNVRRTCEIVGVSRWTVYRWRSEDPEFARDWDLILQSLAEDCIAVVLDRALDDLDEDSAKWILERLLRRYGPRSFSYKVEEEAEPDRPGRRITIVRASENDREPAPNK